MDKKGAGNHEAGQKGTQGAQQLALAAQNIKTAADFARFMTAVMSALLAREIDSATATAICGTANTMLKAIEMQVKYRAMAKGNGVLYLTEAPPVTEVTEVTHVTSVTATNPKAPLRQETTQRKTGPWCTDCYVGRQLYIHAVEEVEGEPVCKTCADKRRKALDPEYDPEHVSKCLECEKKGKQFKTGSQKEWILHMKMQHGVTLDADSVAMAWGERPPRKRSDS